MGEKLWCEQNTPEVEKNVRAAFRDKFDVSDEDSEFEDFTTHYEHGQWWVIAECRADADEESRTFSVVTCQGRDGEDYLDFEEA